MTKSPNSTEMNNDESVKYDTDTQFHVMCQDNQLSPALTVTEDCRGHLYDGDAQLIVPYDGF